MIVLAGCFLFDSKENVPPAPSIKHPADYWSEEIPIPALISFIFQYFCKEWLLNSMKCQNLLRGL